MYHPRLKGKHYDMGFHYGEILLKNGQNFNDYINLTDEQVSFGKDAIKLYEDILPDIMEEVKGLSDGSKTDYFKMATWLKLCMDLVILKVVHVLRLMIMGK